MTPAEHQQGMYRALFAWALTDTAVVLTYLPLKHVSTLRLDHH